MGTYHQTEQPEFREWIQALNDLAMEEVADEYGIDRRGDVILCPEHNDHNLGNCHISHNRYYCFACHGKGDNLRLVQKITGMGFMDAAKDLSGRFGIPVYEYRGQASSKNIDRMPVTKAQLIVLGLIPEARSVFWVENCSCGKPATGVFRADKDEEGIGYLTGSTCRMLMEQLYRDDKEGFFAVIAGKFREVSNTYLALYEAKVWTWDLFPDDLKPDIQIVLEKSLTELNQLAQTLTERKLVNLSYFKLPSFEKKERRYQLVL